jgi:DNA topoisomerase-1
MKLLIVESPAKSKTIERYLGDEYVVESSIGHIRDLTIKGKGGFGVDIENNFQPEYEVLKEKKEVVLKLKKLADQADHIYLATDPDREGEAISWHLQEVLEQPSKKVSRVVFNEITKKAVLNAIPNARQVDMDLVHSQESRRILDRIIGFRLSSLLQQKIGSKSAGRVQSVALKLIVDREKEIEAFDSKEYWDIHALLLKNDNVLKAKFVKDQNGNTELNDEASTLKVIEHLQDAKYVVENIEKKNRHRSSKPPFITSTLQQDAGARLKYNAKRVMMIAQKLYEGIDISDERVGLITYMRTDSIRLSDDFIASAKTYIEDNYGKNYYKGFKSKNKKGAHVQDAHESIRPTSIDRTPEKMKPYLSNDEYKLYTLIYNRAVASLMSDAEVEDTKVNILANDCLFNLEGEKVVFDGFLKIYEEAKIDETEDLSRLPELTVGEELPLQELVYEQKFTNPPYRYTEARLIRKMEELGIGRPSTYALTMETLRLRSYVTMDKRTFVPSNQGRLTSDQLDLFFSSIINVKYTADMENTLDLISEGKAVWYEEIRTFYDTFMPLVENARDNMVKLYPKLTDEYCPECGLPLYIRRGPFGEFTACSGYPHCRYIKKAVKPEPVKTGVECPLCHEGELVERINVRGRNKGTKFYACNRFPDCRATYSGLPTGDKCGECGAPMIEVEGVIRCGNERCKTNRKKKEDK